MKKIIIVLASLIALILIAFGIFLLVQKNSVSSTTPPPTGTLPPVSTSTPLVVPTSTTITIGTSQGSVTVKNFYESAAYITQDQQTVAVTDTPDYVIAYNISDSSFGIALLSTPLEAARQAAESALLSALGVSQKDACKLNVYEGVPADVSDQYVGQSFPLSFCGGPPTL
ncbi:MAG TPA: hypothetical protein VMR99_02955 [Candidatus Paceibacterota bacterium]|nr:hypothetical protein [Candidatus Paceibacterota bacterium]